MNDDVKIRRLRAAAVGGIDWRSRWRARRAVSALAKFRNPMAARALAAVAVTTPDERLATAARRPLADLSDQEAIDHVCDLAVHQDDPSLVALVDEAGYLPSDDRDRALLLFLLHRFDSYAKFDPDGALLRAARERADVPLRGRIAAAARTTERTEWINVAGNPDDLTAEEWDTAVYLLTRSGRWDDLWRLALRAPAVWAAPALRELGRSAPPDNDARRQLVAIAQLCGPTLSAACLFERPTILHEGPFAPMCLAASPTDDLLVAGAPNHLSGPLLWSLPSGAPAAPIHQESSPPAASFSIAIAPDGNMAVLGEFRNVRLQSMHNGPSWASRGWSLANGTGWTCQVAVAPDRFAHDASIVVAADTTGMLRTWLLHAIQRPLGEVQAHRDRIRGLAVSPDGRFVATGRPGEVPRLWVLPSCTPTRPLQDCPSGVTSLVVTPDGGMVIGVEVNGDVRLWNLPNGRPAGTLSPGFRFGVLAMSPDGELLIGCDSLQGSVHVWRMSTRTFAGTLGGYENGADDLVVARDGTVAATTVSGQPHNDGQTILWRPAMPPLDITPPSKITSEDLDRLRERRTTITATDDQALLDLITELALLRNQDAKTANE